MKADFDIGYNEMKNEENSRVLPCIVKCHLADNNSHHLKKKKKIVDGSVIENEQAGPGFVIPEFKTEKSFCLGKEDLYLLQN